MRLHKKSHIYLRDKKADFLLKIRDGKMNLDIIKAREKYEQYQVNP